MRPPVQLEYGKCPTCGAGALIGVGLADSRSNSMLHARIEFIDCTSPECLHYRSLLPAS
jgi:hypothetical protein